MSEQKKHQLVLHDEGEAEASCVCGGWRLLSVSVAGTAAEPEAERNQRINSAFQAHLGSTKGTRGGEASA